MYLFRYVRIRRQNQTYFVVSSPKDTIQTLKEQVAIAAKDEWKAEQMRMIHPATHDVLQDTDTLESLEIRNEDILHVVFQIGEGVWESVHIDSTEPFLGTGAGTSGEGL